MTYEEIQVGERVWIKTESTRYQEAGTVKAKEIVTVAGKPRERVWIDTDRRGRRVCVPSVLDRPM